MLSVDVMTWYDGGEPPVPTKDRHDAPARERVGGGRHAAATSRARLRTAAAPTAHAVVPAPDATEAELPEYPAGRAKLLVGVRWRVPPRVVAVALVALALLGGAVSLRAAATPTAPAVTLPEPAVTASRAPDSGPSPNPGPSPTSEVLVWVHVVGQVAVPGLISLPAGSRVAEAVTAAGGALPDADLAALNLAALVQDGAQVRVPAPGESDSAPPGGVVEGAAPTVGSGAGASAGTVDVNAAGAAELETLPGIGPVLAERIVTWRTDRGPFATVDALQDVPGIGPAVLGQLRDRVRV